jgi:hypothetical protein
MARTTAHDLVLEILRNADNEWTGKTRLFKAFYFAHLYYARDNPGRLTTWPIARLPKGPGIHDSATLFRDLERGGYLTIEHVHEGPYPEERYRLTEKGQQLRDVPEDARAAIKEATLFCKDKSAAFLSQLTHEYSRSWTDGKDGEILNIYLDLIPDDEYTIRQETIDEMDKLLERAARETSG